MSNLILKIYTNGVYTLIDTRNAAESDWHNISEAGEINEHQQY